MEGLTTGIAYFLKWLATICGGNYGLAIILLTVVMRIVLLPLTIKQTKSMIAMQRLQPQLKEIQKKYKDDREKMGQEMMALYKENKVSPLGGCLPLLLQLPIMFALFEVLRNLSNKKSHIYKIITAGVSAAAYKEGLMFLGMDITHVGSALWTKDHDYAQLIVLILLTVVTGYVSAKMMTTDPKQAKMMALMPVLMGVFAWILPVGVTIYIITMNILMIVQQYIQLEIEGFYDELRAQRHKDGWPTNWHQRLWDRSLDLGSRVLIAVRLKKPPAKPLKKKVDSSAGKAAKAGKTQLKGEASKETPKKAVQEKGQQPAQKKPTVPSKPKPGQKQAAKVGEPKPRGGQPGQKAQQKSYPAKKKSTGKK
ncbi:MAG: YidC/Oxa1 family membrane protein insertase [Actinobacteria bacterium]|nr:YidC/Oxa1 family membrane protein insertase [Actinomycetota bacterium]